MRFHSSIRVIVPMLEDRDSSTIFFFVRKIIIKNIHKARAELLHFYQCVMLRGMATTQISRRDVKTHHYYYEVKLLINNNKKKKITCNFLCIRFEIWNFYLE